MMAVLWLPLSRACLASTISSSTLALFSPQPPRAKARAKTARSAAVRAGRVASRFRRIMPPSLRRARSVLQPPQHFGSCRARAEVLPPPQQLLEFRARARVVTTLYVRPGQVIANQLSLWRQHTRFLEELDRALRLARVH